MTIYHAVMLDETRCEFGVTVPADRGGLDPYDWLRENYPESTCVQLETPEQALEREQAIYDRVMREMDGDDWSDDDYDL